MSHTNRKCLPGARKDEKGERGGQGETKRGGEIKGVKQEKRGWGEIKAVV